MPDIDNLSKEESGTVDLGRQKSVSVALTTYNGSNYVEEQIASLLAQDYMPTEIIVCDDNSSDNTVDLIESFDSKIIKIYRNRNNLGYIKNFEQACELCSGDYIALCDQDDIWEPNKISILLETLVSAGANAVFSDATLIDATGSVFDVGLWDAVLKGGKMPEEIDYRSFYLSNCVTGCTLLFDKALLAAAMPFSDSMPHDWWLAYHAAYQDGLTYSEQKLVRYRQHGNNVIGILHNIKNYSSPADFIKRRLKKLSLSDRLQRYAKWHDEVERRLRAYWNFENESGKRPSEELTVLYAWITGKSSNTDISTYDSFFINETNNPAFAFFGPQELSRSRHRAETYKEGVQRIKRRYYKKILITGLLLAIVTAVFNLS